jgi:hypothetical protein
MDKNQRQNSRLPKERVSNSAILDNDQHILRKDSCQAL